MTGPGRILQVYVASLDFLLHLYHEKALGVMVKLDCPQCTPDIEKFYDLSQAMIEYNETMVALTVAQRHGPKLLGGGRVVILRDHVSGFVATFEPTLERPIALQDE